MAESAVSAVLGSVRNLALKETKLLCGVTLEVAFLKDELMRLQAYLKDADSKRRSGNARVAVFVSQIRCASYEAQNVIEAADYIEKRNRLKKGFMGAISRYARLPSDLATLHKVGVEIRRLRRKLVEIFASAENLKIDMENIVVDGNQFPQEFGQMNNNFEHDVFMVGFEDEHNEIVDKLVDNETMLSAVSVVAMGGAGKTTLAKKVVTSYRVKKHFEIVAWVTVSQTFKGIDLLKDILKQIMGDGNEIKSIDQMQEYEVGNKISDLLSQKRYLVVLDDVWEEDTWDQLNRTAKAFPDAAKGSRVLLTTRKVDVANHVQVPTHVHALKHLNEQKSLELFLSKALPSYRKAAICDVDEFEKLGRKLARKCDGLPLALIVLGGYLSRNLNTQSWSDVLLGWPATKNVDMMRDILARSYMDMPNHHLRSCFLYFAAFPEDHVIDVFVLIALWMAEGFIPNAPKREQEETARMYVAELAQRSLVQVTKRSRVHGWIEKIRVHDILRDWCIEEARRDGFLDVIYKTSGQVGAPSTDIMASCRSSYQRFRGENLQETPNLRALIGFELPSVSLPKLRFLRVLHIENSSLSNFSGVIGGCIHLRCLILIHCDDVTLPSSMGKLIYLQTIDMTRTPSLVPTSVWDIPSLRNVCLYDGFSPPEGVQPKQIHAFRVFLNSGDANSKCSDIGMVSFLGQMTELTTLSLQVNGYMSADVINILANMPRLVVVRLYGLSGLYKLPEIHHFPQRLHSLYLSADNITEDPLLVLEKLQYLVLLKLKDYSGRTMSCSAQGFPCLQSLQLLSFRHTEEWRLEVGAMPKLSHLRLEGFPNISDLPEGLLHLPSLGQLKLKDVDLSYITLKKLQQKGCEVNFIDYRN